MRLNSAARIRGERGEVRTRAVAPLSPVRAFDRHCLLRCFVPCHCCPARVQRRCARRGGQALCDGLVSLRCDWWRRDRWPAGCCCRLLLLLLRAAGDASKLRWPPSRWLRRRGFCSGFASPLVNSGPPFTACVAPLRGHLGVEECASQQVVRQQGRRPPQQYVAVPGALGLYNTDRPPPAVWCATRVGARATAATTKRRAASAANSWRCCRRTIDAGRTATRRSAR